MRLSKNCPVEHRKWVESLLAPKIVESGRVPGKGRIRLSIEKLSGHVPVKVRISVSTEIWENSGDYREKVEAVPLLKNYPDEFKKRVESV